MTAFGKGTPRTRLEDRRFLTGQGRYVDDIAPPDALHAVFVRSPVAHGVITALEADAMRAMPGVALVLTAADLARAGVVNRMKATLEKNRDGSRGANPVRPVLADTRVRFVGEAVALVAATTLTEARDAAEVAGLDVDELPVALALDDTAPAIHPREAPGNRAFDFALGDAAAVQAAIAAAAHVVRVSVPDNRIIVASMEPRGVWAAPEADRLHVCVNGQGVWAPRDDLAYHLRLPKDAIRVTNPDVGGGFGMKGMSYPEMVAVAAAARTLGRPVRWMSDRSEAMLTDNAGRDLVSDLTLAFDADLRLTAYHVQTRCNLGAYNSNFAQKIQTELFSKVLTGAYRIPAAYLEVQGFYTNTTPVDAYRGAGRPEAMLALERGMDHAARVLGVDPWELRRRNLLTPAEMPHRTPTGVTYDCGDFPGLLAAAEQAADRAGYPVRQAQAAARGLIRGQGLAYYIESILGDETEHARIVFADDGMVDLYVGTQSNGQGHETVYAQFLADITGMPEDRIRVVQGDSDRIPEGGGTGGSRSVTVQNTATLGAVTQMTAAFGAWLGDAPFDGERFRLPGTNEAPTLLEAADRARAAGRADLLDHRARIRLKGRSFPNGAHVAEVLVDPETGQVQVDRYTVVDDFGTLINPLLVAGQIHGGVAQGLGQILTERVAHDAQGQLLTASFMDYAVPRADDMPPISFTSRPVPTALNPLGMKGCGEAGTVGALGAIANAVADALAQRGAALPDLPLTPERVWRALAGAADGTVA